MDEIVFQIETCDESGVLVASWDSPEGGGITTQGKDLRDLQEQITDAVRCHFDANSVSQRISLRVLQKTARRIHHNTVRDAQH